ncbi:MAG: HAD family phosphatase [Spirochaetaceae bacterium]|nr:HAD family phosphatase [Spirochaetaceae bacterium]
MISGIIFDLDGTLIDSLGFWEIVPEKYLKTIGIKADKDLARQIDSFSLKESAAFFIEKFKLKLSVSQVIDGINQTIEKFYKEEVQLKPGVKEFAALLAEKHVKLAVATSSPAHLAEAALKRLLPVEFACIESCNDCTQGKDESAEVYEKALAKMELSKDNVWVFEDALFALETAKKAGFHVCAVEEAAYQHEAEKIKEIADYYVHNLMDFSAKLGESK